MWRSWLRNGVRVVAKNRRRLDGEGAAQLPRRRGKQSGREPDLDSTGNLYGTTEHGGAYGHGTVFELMPSMLLAIFMGLPLAAESPAYSRISCARE